MLRRGFFTRFSARSLLFCLVVTGLGKALIACGTSDFETGGKLADAGEFVRDGAPVDPTEAGPPSDAASGPPPTCERYCDLVTSNCEGPYAQYASKDDCLAFCRHLPLALPTRESPEHAASVECRQYWADTPARTNPKEFCLAAGPFGGNVCGYRCTAFCEVALAACPPDGGSAAFESAAGCASACTTYSYRDAGAEGGGEGPEGPKNGDTLNCRQYWLREATRSSQKCAALRAQSELCQ